MTLVGVIKMAENYENIPMFDPIAVAEAASDISSKQEDIKNKRMLNRITQMQLDAETQHQAQLSEYNQNPMSKMPTFFQKQFQQQQNPQLALQQPPAQSPLAGAPAMPQTAPGNGLNSALTAPNLSSQGQGIPNPLAGALPTQQPLNEAVGADQSTGDTGDFKDKIDKAQSAAKGAKKLYSMGNIFMQALRNGDSATAEGLGQFVKKDENIQDLFQQAGFSMRTVTDKDTGDVTMGMTAKWPKQSLVEMSQWKNGAGLASLADGANVEIVFDPVTHTIMGYDAPKKTETQQVLTQKQLASPQELLYLSKHGTPEQAKAADEALADQAELYAKKKATYSGENALIVGGLEIKSGRPPTAFEVLQEKVKEKVDTAAAQAYARYRQFGNFKLDDWVDTTTGKVAAASAAQISDELKAHPGKYLKGVDYLKFSKPIVTLADMQRTVNNTRTDLSQMKGDFDPEFLGKLAMVMRETDQKSAMSNFIQSNFAKSLTPDEWKYTTHLRQMIENSMAMRAVVGYGQGSDSLRDAIIATIPNAKTPTKAAAIEQLNNYQDQILRLSKAYPEIAIVSKNQADAYIKNIAEGGPGIQKQEETKTPSEGTTKQVDHLPDPIKYPVGFKFVDINTGMGIENTRTGWEKTGKKYKKDNNGKWKEIQ